VKGRADPERPMEYGSPSGEQGPGSIAENDGMRQADGPLFGSPVSWELFFCFQFRELSRPAAASEVYLLNLNFWIRIFRKFTASLTAAFKMTTPCTAP